MIGWDFTTSRKKEIYKEKKIIKPCSSAPNKDMGDNPGPSDSWRNAMGKDFKHIKSDIKDIYAAINVLTDNTYTNSQSIENAKKSKNDNATKSVNDALSLMKYNLRLNNLEKENLRLTKRIIVLEKALSELTLVPTPEYLKRPRAHDCSDSSDVESSTKIANNEKW